VGAARRRVTLSLTGTHLEHTDDTTPPGGTYPRGPADDMGHVASCWRCGLWLAHGLSPVGVACRLRTRGGAERAVAKHERVPCLSSRDRLFYSVFAPVGQRVWTHAYTRSLHIASTGDI